MYVYITVHGVSCGDIYYDYMTEIIFELRTNIAMTITKTNRKNSLKLNSS